MKNIKKSYVKDCFVFASCKTWNYEQFQSISKDGNADWHYVANESELKEVVDKNKPKYIFFLHWNWIVPESIFGNYECVCFHMTDVPYGRGGSPLQNLILAGHTDTMLTALKMVKELDAGPVYIKTPLSLDGSAEDIYRRAGKLCVDLMNNIIQNTPQPEPQKGNVVMFKRRKPEQSTMPKIGGLKLAYDFIRMLDAEGYPRAYIQHGEYKIFFKNANICGDSITANVEINLINQI